MRPKHAKRYICSTRRNPVIGSNTLSDNLNAVFENYRQMTDRFRAAELKKVSGYWYVEYQYRYPKDVRPEGKQFKRFRIVRELNRILKKQGEEAAERYAHELIKEINFALRDGLNPFDVQKPKPKTELSLLGSIQLYLSTKEREGIKANSMRDYNGYAGTFMEWATGKLNEPVGSVTQEDIDSYLATMQVDRKWSNSTYNNHKRFLSSLFEFLLSKKKVKENPVKGIRSQKQRHKVHKYYDPDLKEAVKKWMTENDPYLLDFCQFVYYSCMRPKAEVRVIQIGDIFLERRLIRVNGKTDDRYVPICHELFEYLEGLNLKQYPNDYYLFSHNGPGAKRVGNGFFSLRYQAMKDTLNIPYEYTIYSWKHTRVIDLIMSGMSAVDAMQITGHTDFTSFQKYLRDLGAAMSGKVIGETVKF